MTRILFSFIIIINGILKCDLRGGQLLFISPVVNLITDHGTNTVCGVCVCAYRGQCTNPQLWNHLVGEYWDGFVADHAIEIKTHDDRHRPLIEIDMLQVSPGRHTNWPGLQVQTLAASPLTVTYARPWWKAAYGRSLSCERPLSSTAQFSHKFRECSSTGTGRACSTYLQPVVMIIKSSRQQAGINYGLR